MSCEFFSGVYKHVEPSHWFCTRGITNLNKFIIGLIGMYFNAPRQNPQSGTLILERFTSQVDIMRLEDDIHQKAMLMAGRADGQPPRHRFSLISRKFDDKLT